MNKRVRFLQVVWVVMFCSLAGSALARDFLTITPGELRIAVTRASSTDPYDSQLWIRKYLEKFAQEQALQIVWVEVPFSESWLLASRNEVDIVATNVASFADRQSAGAFPPFCMSEEPQIIRKIEVGIVRSAILLAALLG